MRRKRRLAIGAGGPRRIGRALVTVNSSTSGGMRMISWARGWGRQAARWAGDGADLLFPRCCGRCRGEVDLAAHGLCRACARDLAADGPRCQRCAAPADAGPACRACRRSAAACDGVVVLGGYDGPLREAVLTIKRPGAEPLARSLAALIVEKHRGPLEAARCDVVVPVPMHWWRRARRGTSAAEEIAAAVGRALGLPVVGMLARSRATRMQNELPPEDRAGNVAGAFCLRRGTGGRRVLVVDDVVTTGATLAACAAALRAGGAAAVFAAAVARADAAPPAGQDRDR